MTEDLELDWARELFDRARGAGEPRWTADPAALARAGVRRRRLRTARAGGGLAGVVAMTVAVAVGLGAGATDLGSQPGPGGAWGNRPLSDVFKYVIYLGAVDKSGHSYLPVPAVADLAAVVGRLDPSFTHLVGSHDNSYDPRIVAAGDARAKQAKSLGLSSVWANDTLRQSGQLTFGFASSSGWAQTLVSAQEPGADQLTAPCSTAVSDIPPVSGFGSAAPSGSGSAPSLSVRWSPCTVSHLQDGSTIGSASVRIGAGTVAVALREFADGEVFSIVAQDFKTPWLQGTAPDPATVVQPTPWTEQSLVAALADPAVQSGWNPIPPLDSDGKLLQPSDLRPGWYFDTSQPAEGTNGRFVMVNGCGEDQTVLLARSGSDAHFKGLLPNGVFGTAYEGEYQLLAGSGPQTMTKARLAAQSGCKAGSVDYSKDTVMALPAGIGDDAFAASVPGLGMVSVEVRVGDTILRTDLSDSNTVRDASWTDHQPLDLTVPANQQWLASIARSMVSRYTAGATHH